MGYAFGNRVGKRVFQREDSLLFHKDNLERTRAFYERHGKKTIILARFVPVIRTFAPIVAGVGDMEYRTFLAFNVAGGLLWAVGITVMGYYLGKSIPDVDRYLLPILAVIILASVAPGIIHVLKEESQRKRLFLLLKKPFKRKKAP